MTAPIGFTQFTDPTVMFATKDAANQFFNGMIVRDATTLAAGVVKQAVNVPVSGVPATTYVTVVVINPDGTQVAATVPSKASYDQLYASYLALLLAIKNAGIMPTDP